MARTPVLSSSLNKNTGDAEDSLDAVNAPASFPLFVPPVAAVCISAKSARFERRPSTSIWRFRPVEMDILSKTHFDVLASIISWLDALSIIRLSRVSKKLHEIIANDRGIWLGALRSLTNEECLMPSVLSYGPLETLSTEEIRRLATLPDRIHYAMVNTKMPKLPARRIKLNLGGPHKRLSGKATLVPGGRWLINTICDHDTFDLELACWDLSCDLSGVPELFPVARVVINHGTYVQNNVHPTIVVSNRAENQVILLTTLTMSSETVTLVVSSLSFTTRSYNPVLDSCASISVSSNTKSPGTMHGDFVQLSSSANNSSLLWNWRDGSYGWLQFPSRFKMLGIYPIPPFVYGVNANDGQLFSFKIPALRSILRPPETHNVEPVIRSIDGIVPWTNNLYVYPAPSWESLQPDRPRHVVTLNDGNAYYHALVAIPPPSLAPSCLEPDDSVDLGASSQLEPHLCDASRKGLYARSHHPLARGTGFRRVQLDLYLSPRGSFPALRLPITQLPPPPAYWVLTPHWCAISGKFLFHELRGVDVYVAVFE